MNEQEQEEYDGICPRCVVIAHNQGTEFGDEPWDFCENGIALAFCIFHESVSEDNEHIVNEAGDILRAEYEKVKDRYATK